MLVLKDIMEMEVSEELNDPLLPLKFGNLRFPNFNGRSGSFNSSMAYDIRIDSWRLLEL